MMVKIFVYSLVIGFIFAAVPMNYMYYKYRVEVIRGDIAWDIPTANFNPLK